MNSGMYLELCRASCDDLRFTPSLRVLGSFGGVCNKWRFGREGSMETAELQTPMLQTPFGRFHKGLKKRGSRVLLDSLGAQKTT